jgi:hypothetical protein
MFLCYDVMRCNGLGEIGRGEGVGVGLLMSERRRGAVEVRTLTRQSGGLCAWTALAVWLRLVKLFKMPMR